jgi:hypothetical protein
VFFHVQNVTFGNLFGQINRCAVTRGDDDAVIRFDRTGKYIPYGLSVDITYNRNPGRKYKIYVFKQVSPYSTGPVDMHDVPYIIM